MKKDSDNFCQITADNEICLCSIEGIIKLLSKKWALLIIGLIGNHEKIRFNEIMKNLKTINPTTLSDRLTELNDAGLVKKEIFPEIPPRVEYSLTQDGFEVREAMIPLMKWVSKKESCSNI